MHDYRNEVTFQGQIDREPDFRRFDSGKCNCTLSILTAAGKDMQSKTWHRVVVWDGDAELASALPVGTWVLVHGYQKTRMWQGQDGRKNYITEVVARTIAVLETDGCERPATGAEPPPAPSDDDLGDLPF